jgi:hypothetical protein
MLRAHADATPDHLFALLIFFFFFFFFFFLFFFSFFILSVFYFYILPRLRGLLTASAT